MLTTCRSQAIGLACALTTALSLHAQEIRPRDHGQRMLTKALDLEQHDDLAGAEQVYASVHPCDSVYEDALLYRSAMLLKLKRPEDAIALCDEGIALDGDQLRNFHINKGVALSQAKRYDEALRWYDAAILRFPGSVKLHRQRAGVLDDMGDKKAALAAYEDNVVRFPTSPDVHFTLGAIALGEGKTSQAALAFFMAMVVSWNDRTAEASLTWADQLLDGKTDKDPKGYDLATGDDFSEMDLLLANKVAMNKGYKAQPDLSYAVIRQGHFLLNSLKNVPEGNGFWNTFYVPYFKDLVARGQVEAFLLHCLDNSSAEKVKAIAVKHKSDVLAFRKSLAEPFRARFATFPDSIGNTLAPVNHTWNGAHDLIAMGTGDMEKDEETGEWIFFHQNGAVSARGSFGADHKKTGEWKNFFPDGRRSRSSEWTDGKENGVLLTWHQNGALKDSVRLVDGDGDGPYAEHANTGWLNSRKTFSNKELTGKASFYHANNTLDYRADLVKDNMTGAVDAFFADGRPRFSGSFADGFRDGVVKTFFTNGRPESTYTYARHKRNGPFTIWFRNGNKKEEGTLADDQLVGAYREWYIDGALSTEANYDDQGRLQGVRKDWSDEGHLFTETEYNRGLLIRYRYYDAKGNVVSEKKRSNGKFDMVGYTPEGHKMQEGSYRDEGLQEGAWKWYWPDGTVSREATMQNGNEDGPVREYYSNGMLHNQYDFLPGQGRTGVYTEFGRDGKVRSEGYLEKGDWNGELRKKRPDGSLSEESYYAADSPSGSQRYYDSDGVLYMTERYLDGTVREIVEYGADGKEYNRVVMQPGTFKCIMKHPDGSVRSEVNYVNMVKQGKATWFYPDGSRSSEGNYVENETNGTWHAWHPNGKLQREWTMDMGTPTGTDRSYDIDGVLESERTYVDGTSTGWKRWYPNGKIAMDRPSVNGLEQGTANVYTEAGDLQMIRYYSHDRLIGYSYLGRDGKPVDTIPLEQGIQHMRTFYPNGAPSREMDLRNGELEGTYKEFYPDGTLMEQTTYTAGGATGSSTEYHPNGKVSVQCTYVAGERNGEQVLYYDNGQPKDRCNWSYGERHGTRTLYDRTGKPTLVLTYRNDEAIKMAKP